MNEGKEIDCKDQETFERIIKLQAFFLKRLPLTLTSIQHLLA